MPRCARPPRGCASRAPSCAAPSRWWRASSPRPTISTARGGERCLGHLGREALALRERALAKARLLSPFAGTVTARLAEVGEVVAPGRPVLRLARTDPVWVRAYLEAPELARVRLGQRVEVRAPGLSAPLAGRLAFVSPRAEFTPKTVETREVRAELVYRIRVDVPNPGGALKIGQPVELRFAGVGG